MWAVLAGFLVRVFGRKGSAAQVVVVGGVRGLGTPAKCGGQGNRNLPPAQGSPSGLQPCPDPAGPG